MAFFKLNNDDIFISYARSDARTYTDGLANELTKKGFACFTDALGTDAGKDVPESLFQKLKDCSMLVVVGSSNAASSVAVGKEVETFSTVKGTTAIILIDFNDVINQASWQHFVIGLRREKEEMAALETGNPTPAIVSRIEKAFSYRKNKDRLKRYTRTAIIILALLLVAIAAASFFANMQLKEARQQQQIATSLDFANESQAMLRDPKLIVTSVEKAIQSMEIDVNAGRHSLVPDMALRSSLAFLPDLKETKAYPGQAFFFAPGGNVIEERSTDSTRAFYRQGENNAFFEVEADPYAVFAVNSDCRYVVSAFSRSVTVTNTMDNTMKDRNLNDSEDKEVNQVAISPDGRYVVIVYHGEDAGDFDSMEMWDTKKDTVVVFHSDVNVNSVCFSSNGNVLAMGCRGFDMRGSQVGVALLWDLSYMDTTHLDQTTFANPYRHQQEGEIWFIAPGEDYTSFASSQQSNVTVWKYGVGNRYYPLSYIPTSSTVYSLVFKPGMKELGVVETMNNDSTRSSNSLSTWNYKGYKEKDKWFLPQSVNTIAYTDDPNVIMGFGPYAENEVNDRMIYWQTKKDSAILSYGANFQSEEMLYHSDDLGYIITSGDSLHIWNHTHLKYTIPYDSSNIQFSHFDISNDGKWLTLLQYDNKYKQQMGMIYGLNGNSYENVSSFPYTGEVKTMSVSPENNTLFLLDDKGNVTALDLTNAQSIPTIIFTRTNVVEVESFKISPQGKFVCMAVKKDDINVNKTSYQLVIREIKTGKTVELVNDTYPINYYFWTGDDHHILFNYNNHIQVADVESKKLVLDIYNAAAVSAVSISPSGKYIGYGTENGNVRIIETSSISEVVRIKTDGKIIGLTFSNDDRYFATSANNTSFLDLNPEENNILSSWNLSAEDLIIEAKNRTNKINQR